MVQQIKDRALPLQQLGSLVLKLPHATGVVKKNFFFLFLQSHLQHREVPGPRVKLELQLPPTTQPWQLQILNPLSTTRTNPRPHRDNTESLTSKATTGTTPLQKFVILKK